MTTYLNPKMIEWFNEWQSTPDLLGVPIEEQEALLTQTMAEADEFKYIWKSLPPHEQTEELLSWLYFFMSMYVSEIVFGDYKKWLLDITASHVAETGYAARRGVITFPDYGINDDMIQSMIENYQSNFEEEFVKGGNTWWRFNFLTMLGNHSPTYPPLGGNLKFGPILNWINENPFEVKQ